jgi:hypothetical protein
MCVNINDHILPFRFGLKLAFVEIEATAQKKPRISHNYNADCCCSQNVGREAVTKWNNGIPFSSNGAQKSFLLAAAL